MATDTVINAVFDRTGQEPTAADLANITPELQPLAVPVNLLQPDPVNARTGHDTQGIAASLANHGQRTALVVNASDEYRILKGNGTFAAAVSLGWQFVAAIFVDDEAAAATAYAIADNALGDKSKFDPGRLLSQLRALPKSTVTGFSDSDVRRMIAKATKPPGAAATLREEQRRERAGVAVDEWPTKLGEVWQLGRHRLIVGDCTSPAITGRLFDGQLPDAVTTDPPYCSGGRQEAGKAQGSVGTRGKEQIARDTLSTRGYQKLIAGMLAAAGNPGVVYSFTDWRMWTTLQDLYEAAGLLIRQMIVWDKLTPGMGAGWRNQHELVMVGTRIKGPFGLNQAAGNVIGMARTGNHWHETEKPIGLFVRFMEVADQANIIYDPFCGSGPAFHAAELLGRTAYACELKPAIASTALMRWANEGPGPAPELIG